MTTGPRAATLLWVAFLLCPSSWAYNQIGRRALLEDDTLDLYDVADEPNFLRPKHLQPGELATVVRRDTGETIDRGTFFIGLPPELTQRFQEYINESGLMELAQQLMYENPVQPDENRLYKLDYDDTTWGVRTSNNWVRDGDMTWIDPADEYTYEKILDFYRQANFDVVLDTLGEKFGCDSLWLDGTSFIVVSHFHGNNIHTDLDGMENKVFNVLFPLVIPEAGGMLEVASRGYEDAPLGSVFRFDQGVLVGGESPHGTGNVDYRPTQEFRMAVAVYMDDLNADNVEEFDDDTASFPPGGDLPYLVAQGGRHWSSDGTASLKRDPGRRPYPVEDEEPDDCPQWHQQGLCLTELEVRNLCIKTCRVYLENQEYYDTLGKLLNWPTETEQEAQ